MMIVSWANNRLKIGRTAIFIYLLPHIKEDTSGEVLSRWWQLARVGRELQSLPDLGSEMSSPLPESSECHLSAQGLALGAWEGAVWDWSLLVVGCGG